jgi:hypothetical protein
MNAHDYPKDTPDVTGEVLIPDQIVDGVLSRTTKYDFHDSSSPYLSREDPRADVIPDRYASLKIDKSAFLEVSTLPDSQRDTLRQPMDPGLAELIRPK